MSSDQNPAANPEKPAASAGSAEGASPSETPALALDDRFKRIERLVALLAAGKVHAVFVAGQPGVAKTTTVLATLAAAGLVDGQDFVVCRGHSSTLGLYMALYQHSAGATSLRPQIMVFDDCDGALRSRDAVNILKATLDDKVTRTVSFLSSRLPNGIPTTFAFNGRVIFISNLRLGDSKDADLEAIRSRCHYAEVYLNRRELMEFIAQRVVPTDDRSTTLSERRYVFERFRQAATNSPISVSIRTFRQLLDLFVLDRDHFDLHVDELLPQSEDVRLLRSLLERNMTTEDAAREYQVLTGKSRRTFFLLKARYRELLGP